ncbi:hypothetical protein OpiT1DRAFT_04288 [Opitutaceae bacterium TAV1]|nr:hypothetical protein OpiT1DRAFT_04288 [Opitutaceae bacterium TAV1]
MNIMKKPIQTRAAVRTLRRAFLTLGTPGALGLALLALAAPHARASTLLASDGAASDYFGYSASLSGDSALVGAYYDDDLGSNSGSAWYYKGLDGKSGTVNESVKLLASDGAASDQFGNSVSLVGDSALVGASLGDGNVADTGSAYYYKGLSGKSGTVTQNVKLLASDGAATDRFGYSVSLSGDSALVAAYTDGDKGSNSGSAYYFKGLDSAVLAGTQVVNESVKLLASDGAAANYFGYSVSLSGDSALAGAYGDDNLGTNSGSAYYFKGLDGKSGTVNESVKLLASDGAEDDRFGYSVSLSGDSALVGALQNDEKASNAGAAYYYKGLDNATGPAVTESMKLLASDGAATDRFGYSVSLSADSALVGAFVGDGNVANTGAAYYYKGLDGKSGKVTQDVKLLASDGAVNDRFGNSVSLEGDRFVIGALMADPDGKSSAGKAYAGDIRAFTTLDAGGTALATDGLSFVSQGDWVVGATSSGNAVTLSKTGTVADTATVTATGKAVYIGQAAGADGNTLLIQGTLTASDIYIGAAGNTGNALIVAAGGSVSNARLHIGGAGDNTVTVESTGIITANALSVVIDSAAGYGFVDNAGSFTFNSGATLDVALNYTPVIGAEFDLVSGSGSVTNNSAGLANGATFMVGEVEFQVISTGSRFALVVLAAPDPAVPEPATYAALAGLAILGYAALRRSGRRATRG